MFNREWANEAWRFFVETDAREKRADVRSAEIAKAHRDGWQLVARAIAEGLGGIAKAITNRR